MDAGAAEVGRGARGPVRPVRLPLQTGAGALRDVVAASVFGTALIVAAIAAVAVLARMALAQRSVEDGLGVGALAAIAAVALAGAGGRAFVHGLASARDHRASDVVLSTRGIEVIGGRRDGLAIGWDGIDAARSSLEDAVTGFFRYPGATSYRRALFLATTDGDSALLGESADDDEDEALDVVLGAIRAAAGLDAAAPRPAHATALACAACGAPAAIDDVDAVPCAFCGRAVPVPPELRARIREARERGARREKLARLAARLLATPGAFRTTAGTSLAAVAVAAASLAVVAAAAACAWSPASAPRVLPPLVPLSAAVVAVVLAAAAHVVERRGVRQLTLGFTAHRSADGGFECRRCGAPMRADDEPILARCAYCATDNVLAPGLGPSAAALGRAEDALDDVLATVRARRALAWLGCAAAVVLAIATARA